MAHDNLLSVALREVGNRHYWTPADGARRVKFAIIVVDYFTKWAEAIPLSTIIEKNLT